MSGYVLKGAVGPVTYVMDWRRGHLAPGEKVLRDLGWSVQPDAPGGVARLVVTEQAHDPGRSWATFEGGAPGRVYTVANRVRTSDDRVLSRAIVMRVAGVAAGEGRRPIATPAPSEAGVAPAGETRRAPAVRMSR